MAKTVRQKRRNKSSRAIVRLPNSRKKRLNPTGNAIVAAAWNKKETLTQNYRRLGLVTRLQKAAGGVEKFPNQPLRSTAEDGNHPLAIASAAASSALGEVRVERDAAGRIVRLVQPAVDNPLNDPLHHLDSDDDGQEWGGIEGEDEDEDEDENDDDKDDDDDESRPAVIRALERQARRPVVKRRRHQSEREREWLGALVQRHGDDTAAMARDRQLNPMQQTAADLAGRIHRMNEGLSQ